MSTRLLEEIRDLIQQDVGGRGLRTDPAANLCTACAGDFAAACRSLAETAEPAVGVVTGFLIPHAEPPAAETDGPLGALFLARVLTALAARVVLATDAFGLAALQAGLETCGLEAAIPVVVLPNFERARGMTAAEYWETFAEQVGRLTHLVAIERVGPSHTSESVRSQPGATEPVVERFVAEVRAEDHDRCHNMRGLDITTRASPAHRLFEEAHRQMPRITTIGIGDGGNEIGMGKIPWDVIRRNIPRGGRVACRVATDYLIVSGVSNWGAYGLAAGVSLLRGVAPDLRVFSAEREAELLGIMVERGPLVDGATGRPTRTVDGLGLGRYMEPLRRLGTLRVP